MKKLGMGLVAIAATLGGAPAPAHAGVADYNALPKGHMPKQPASSSRPASIPANEKVDGVFVSLGPKEQREREAANGFVQVHVFSNEQRAKDFTSGKFRSSNDEPPRVCMTSSQFGGMQTDVESDWPGMSMTELSFTSSRRKQDKERSFGGMGGVTAVHQERLAADGSGKATLEFVDAWIDPETLGARQIARGSMPLVRVASGPSGLEVYGARDDGIVHFVVRAGNVPEEAKVDGSTSFMQSIARRLMAQMPGAFSSGSSECGHLRVSLEAGARAAQMATVQATALFPPLEKPKDDEDDAANAAPSSGPGAVKMNNAMRAMRAFRAVRKRQLLVNLSASQTTSDPQPLLSVSFGWAGKEDEQQF
jgi:hypothetical protein